MSSDPEFDTAELVVAKMALELLRSERDRLAAKCAELVKVLTAVLPYIDDASDVAQFYPDSSATNACRSAVVAARAALERAKP